MTLHWVPDTSVALKWIQREEVLADRAMALLDAYLDGRVVLTVPSLLAYEAANVLRYRATLTTTQIEVAVQGLFDLDLAWIAPSPAMVQRTVALAREYGTSVYDATFAALAEAKSGVSVGERPGGGAAGGLGAAALLLDGALVSGADEVLRRVDAEERVRRATWVWGGEGRVDGQSGAGKAMMALARLCRRQARPLVLFCGEDAGGEALLAEGVCAVFPIGPGPRSLDVALSATRGDLQRCATQVLRVLKWGCGGASIESCNGGS